MFLLLLLLPLFYLPIAFLLHYRRARPTSLPIVPTLVGNSNIMFILSRAIPWRIIKRHLPPRFVDWLLFQTASVRHHTKFRFHERWGETVMITSPTGLVVVTADPEVANQVNANHKAWGKNHAHYEAMNVYGPNMLTANGQEWTRHKRFNTGPGSPFSEVNSAMVWKESLNQTIGMISTWENAKTTLEKPDIQDSLGALVLNVFSLAGFGVKLSFGAADWRGGDDDEGFNLQKTDSLFSNLADNSRYGVSRTYRKSIMDFGDASLKVLAVTEATKGLPDWVVRWMPKEVRRVVEIREELRWYLIQLINRARRKMEVEKEEGGYRIVTPETATQKDDLLTRLVNNSCLESERRESRVHGKKWRPFDETEILGNVYMFSFGGHETSTWVLQCTMLQLAVNQDAQRWLHEMLDECLEDEAEDPRMWDYGLFGKLKAPLCVMYETLRLHPPIPIITRITHTPQILTSSIDEQHHIPAKTDVALNAVALHHHPLYWGPDADCYDPTRWDPKNADAFLHRFTPQPHDENQILKPFPGSWQSFAGGVRTCLGRKFATVEFLAVLSLLMRKYRVEILRMDGETEEAARVRAQDMLDGSRIAMTLALEANVGLGLVERERYVGKK